MNRTIKQIEASIATLQKELEQVKSKQQNGQNSKQEPITFNRILRNPNNANGGAVLRFELCKNYYKVAWAICTENDQFNKNIGIKIASNNLNNNRKIIKVSGELGKFPNGIVVHFFKCLDFILTQKPTNYHGFDFDKSHWLWVQLNDLFQIGSNVKKAERIRTTESVHKLSHLNIAIYHNR